MEYIIEFGKSSSTSFSAALKIAEAAPGFRYISNDNKYSVTYNNLSNFIELAHYVRGWKSSRFKIDNKVLSFLDLMKLFRIYECYADKQDYINKKNYCNTSTNGERLIFPCRYINIREYEFSEGKYGEVKDDKILIDKERLKFGLEQQARQNMCHCCPDMNLVKLLGFAKEFPDNVDLSEKNIFGGRTTKGLFVEFSFSADQADQEDNKLDDLLKDIDGL